MTAPKTLSAEDLNRVIEWAEWRSQQINDGYVSPIDTKPDEIACALLQEHRRTEELEKEVERLQPLNASTENVKLRQDRDTYKHEFKMLQAGVERFQKERNEAIEMAEKLERRLTDALLLNKRFEGDVRDYKEELGQATHELNQALALAKTLSWALGACKYVSSNLVGKLSNLDIAESIDDIFQETLSASPTSLLERFKADEKIIEAAIQLKRSLDRSCPVCDLGHAGATCDCYDHMAVQERFNEALEAREKLK